MPTDPKRACPTCMTQLQRRKREGWAAYALRVYCGTWCYRAAIKAGKHHRRLGAQRP